MQTYGRLPVAFVRGEGTDAVGQRGPALPRLPRRARGHLARPRASRRSRTRSRTRRGRSCTSRTSTTTISSRGSPRGSTRRLGGGGRVFFANSGAEANECAIKVARRYGQTHGGPARHEIVAAYGSFHGRTLASLAATGQPQKHEAFQPLPPGFRHVPFADLEALAAALDERACAVLLEAVQGEGGVQPAPPGYLEAVRTLCDEREALLIIDEVQTGLGRTGAWFGFEHAGIRPDVVTLAKALGNGVPIGACWARAEVATALRPGDHASTFGGQPLAARAALAVLDAMEAADVPTLAPEAGARLSAALQALPAVESVRGLGLLLAAQLADGIDAGVVAGACLDAGLVVNAVTPTALRFAPPLLVSGAEIDEAVAILADVLETFAAGEPAP